jgi:hypothetical protein
MSKATLVNLHDHYCHRNATMTARIVAHVAVNNINTRNVTMEMQQ